jgi:hypothetical protein
MKSFFLNRAWVMFVAGLLLGTLIFFPSNQIKEKLFAYISKTSGAKLQAEQMNFGTGFSLGLSKGGLLGLNFRKLSIQSGAASLDCDEATISPHLITFFVGQLSVGLRCHSDRHGAFDAKLALTPFWSPASLHVSANFKGLNLAAFADSLQSYPIRGVLYGDLFIEDMPFNPPQRGMPPLRWKLAMQKVVLPALNSDFLSIPEIPLGTIDTQGSLIKNKLVMAPLLMGNASSPLNANLDIELALDPSGVPSNGEIKGHLKAVPAWEQSMKQTLDLALLFGEPDETGARRFRKVIQGGPISLLSPPLPY